MSLVGGAAAAAAAVVLIGQQLALRKRPALYVRRASAIIPRT